MEAIVQQLQQALECPCCMEKPKPGVTIVAMCSSGHMTCRSCHHQILLQSDNPTCPVCRDPSFQLIRGHKLATTLIQIMSNHTVYTCKHTGCSAEISGPLLIQHEQSCTAKPIRCPRFEHCSFTAPINTFLAGQHARCTNIYSISEATQNWTFVWDMTTLFSFDTCDINISPRFKPVLLKGVIADRDHFESHAYIGAKNLGGTAHIFVGWLNEKQCLEEKYQNAVFSLSVYVNTPHGKVGASSAKSPIFQGEYGSKINGIYLPKSTLYTWAEFTKDMKCPECPHHKKGHPHLHIKIHLK